MIATLRILYRTWKLRALMWLLRRLLDRLGHQMIGRCLARLSRKILQNFKGALQDGIGDDLAIRPKVKTRSVVFANRKAEASAWKQLYGSNCLAAGRGGLIVVARVL